MGDDEMSTSMDRDPHTHEMAETYLKDGSWRLLYGPVGWAGNTKRYFLHHTCGVHKDDGTPQWVTWFVNNLGETPDWCKYCHTPPPEGLLATFVFVGYYK
jgi:hypothetical protein